MSKKTTIRVVTLLSFVGVFLLLRFLGFDRYLSFEYVQESRELITNFVSTNYLLSISLYILIYIVVVLFSLPGAAMMSLLAGFAFGMSGVLFVNLGATTGSFGAFLFARFIFGDSLQKKYPEKLSKLNIEIETSGINYVLILRLVPVFPFFLVNLLLGLTKIRATTFIWTTALGIIPGSIAYVYAGKRLGEISSIKDIISPQILTVFVLFGLIAMLPIVIKKIKAKG